jgi:hypothetical protein
LQIVSIVRVLKTSVFSFYSSSEYQSAVSERTCIFLFVSTIRKATHIVCIFTACHRMNDDFIKAQLKNN